MKRRVLIALVVVLLIGAVGIVATSNREDMQRPVAVQDELDPESRQGTRLYVALGDSFSSGEGDPFVDPGALTERYGTSSLDDLRACPGAPADMRTVGCGPDPDWVENDLGWLGDTGSDLDAIDNLLKRNIALLYDSKNFGGNNCHRSGHAYPVRVASALEQEDSNWRTIFAACSGAKSDAYWDNFNGEPAQGSFLQQGTVDLVTVGFGGNDVGFGDLVSCGLGEASIDRGIFPSLLGDTVTEIDGCKAGFGPSLPDKLTSLRGNLGRMFEEVMSSSTLSEGARIVAVGYPRVFPNRPPDSCSLGNNASIGYDSMVWLNEVADRINYVIRTTASEYGVSYVDTTGAVNDTRLDGQRHDFCEDDGRSRWINRLVPSDLNRSMHPRFQYHEQVAGRVGQCISSPSTCEPRLTLARWVAEENRRCIPNMVDWYPDSDNETKRRGIISLGKWLAEVQPPPAVVGGLRVLELRVAYYEAARKAIEALIDPETPEVVVRSLDRERDVALDAAAEFRDAHRAADDAVSRLRPRGCQ